MNFKWVVLFVLVSPVTAGELSGQSKPQQETSKDSRKKQERLQQETASAYRQALTEIEYIITPEEAAAFHRLSTNEEREQFLEQFWLRRDPTPDTVENEFREEHYRRIAYANERFSSGIPGWKTDRGRIYIIWGPADEVETHAGGSYNRTYEEGGGSTSVHPFERWRYRHLEGLGSDVVLEFVDTSNSGEFRMTMDPSEKDALKHVPGAGQTDAEARGMMTRAQRLMQGPRYRMGMNQFDALAQYAGAMRPPPVKNRDLQGLVTARIVRDQIRFSQRFDFLRITTDSVLVPITVQIPNRQMSFETRQGVHQATLNLFGRITTLAGRVVQTFEDVIQRDIPDSLLRPSLDGSSVYQKAVPLRPGLYRLDLVLKDVRSGNVGTSGTLLAVRSYEPGKLDSSTLVLADIIERVPRGELGFGPFVLGRSKVRPRLDATFTPADKLGIYLQVYNLQADAVTKRPSALIEFRILKGKDPVATFSERSQEMQVNGEQITIEKLVSLEKLTPGEYRVEVSVTDDVTKATITPSATFVVRAAPRGDAGRGAATR